MADANVNTVSITEKQKVKEITDKLEEGLKELFESEKYKNYLSTMSKFHNYSFNNTLLIALQRPDASLVAGYQAWQKNFNRHVKRGEKGIRILAPAPYALVNKNWTLKLYFLHTICHYCTAAYVSLYCLGVRYPSEYAGRSSLKNFIYAAISSSIFSPRR